MTFIFLICFLFASNIHAKIYSWTDENGVKHFTDSPTNMSIKCLDNSSAFTFSGTEKTQEDLGGIQGEKALYKRADQLMNEHRGEGDKLIEAEKLLQKILEINPNSALAYTGLSRVVRRSGQVGGKYSQPGYLAKSQKYLNKALGIDPTLYDAYWQGVYLYSKGNDLQTAKKMAQKAYEINPHSAKTDIMFAQLAFEAGDEDAVIRRSNAVISKTRNEACLHDAYFFLVKVYKKQGKYVLVEDTYLKSLEAFPNNAWQLDSYAGFLALRNRLDEAIEYAEKAISIMDFGMVRNRLKKLYIMKGADLLYNQGKPKEASDFFLSSIKYAPSAEAYIGLGTSYSMIGSKNKDNELLKKGIEAIEMAIELNPENGAAKRQLKAIRRLL